MSKYFTCPNCTSEEEDNKLILIRKEKTMAKYYVKETGELDVYDMEGTTQEVYLVCENCQTKFDLEDINNEENCFEVQEKYVIKSINPYKYFTGCDIATKDIKLREM